MKVLVLGAGVVGTASAWYLAKAGHEVTVLERRPVSLGLHRYGLQLGPGLRLGRFI